MSEHQTNPVDLDALFAAEMGNPIEPSADFLSRIMDDAMTTQAGFNVQESEPVVEQSLWGSIVGIIGGWPTLAGLATATVAGVWIGISPPESLNTLTDSVVGTSFGYSDYLPNLDSVLTEG